MCYVSYNKIILPQQLFQCFLLLAAYILKFSSFSESLCKEKGRIRWVQLHTLPMALGKVDEFKDKFKGEPASPTMLPWMS